MPLLPRQDPGAAPEGLKITNVYLTTCNFTVSWDGGVPPFEVYVSYA